MTTTVLPSWPETATGSFNGPNDPKLTELRGDIPILISELLRGGHTRMVLAPASDLLRVPKP